MRWRSISSAARSCVYAPRAKIFAGGLAIATAFLAGCSSSPSTEGWEDLQDSGPAHPVDLSGIPDAVPKDEPQSRYGNPISYQVNGKLYFVSPTSHGYKERGIASWYGTKFHGRRTSSGEIYDMYSMTAAHKTLPLPTYARITNLENGNSVVVKINDRGPFHENRLIDLSYVAASKLGVAATGTGLVEVQALDPGKPVAGSPTVSRKPSTSPSMYVQVGAFGSRFNADKLRERLRQLMDSKIRIQPTMAAGEAVYRVQVGPVASVEKTDALTAELSQCGFTDVHVVVE